MRESAREKMSEEADIYINDAFSVAHRSHASVVGFPKVLDAGIGRLMEHELRALERAVDSIERPCVYVLGGAKPPEVFDIMKGPAGVFEKEGFAKGTKRILKAISDSDAFSLLGGGHTSAAISELGMEKSDHVHVSLAGGAFLRYLLGEPLPGIEVLKKQ